MSLTIRLASGAAKGFLVVMDAPPGDHVPAVVFANLHRPECAEAFPDRRIAKIQKLTSEVFVIVLPVQKPVPFHPFANGDRVAQDER
jgi:hypothetical protein